MAAHVKAKEPRRWLRLLGLIAIPLSFALTGGTAWAFWLAGSTATSNGASAATSVNSGATPTTSVAGTAVTVSWAASTLASGVAVTGYQVKRYDATTLVAQTILTACTGTVSATSCVESAVPQGSWKYSVTPVFATNWRGAESAKSTTVVVDNIPPVNAITLSSVTGAAYLSGTNLYYLGTAAGSFKLTNAVTDSGTGPASSQTATLTGVSTGWTHAPSTVSTPAGGPYVSNTFSWTAGTTTGPGEAVVGRDVIGNTATTNLTFVNDITGPTGATVTYADGPTGGTTVSVSFTAGSDAGSGIGTRLLQRASATATMAGACGAYGAFATVTGGTNPTSPLVDTVTIGNCYKYQYVVSDNLGNFTTATNTNVARAPYGASYALNENAGTSTADGTGMGNTGTLAGGAGWTTGRFGSAVSLNGTTGYVDIPRPVIDTSQSYSVAAWVKLSALTGTDQSLVGLDGTNSSPFRLSVNSSNQFRFAQHSSDSGSPTTTAQVLGIKPVVGEWYHVVGVYNKAANTIQLYVNGISQGSATATTAWTATGHTTIGRDMVLGAPARFVNGAIDDVYFYDRAITAAEVVALRGPFGGYWAFNTSSGSSAVDSSGNTNTGTLQAAAGWTTGKIGSNALNLNGTSTSYVDVNTPVIDSGQSYTVATWVKLNNVTTAQTFTSIDGVNISPFGLQLTNTGVFRFTQFSTDATASASASVSSSAVSTGVWYHVAGVYDKTANTITLYVNGVSQGSATGVAAWTAYGHTSIGRSLLTTPTAFVNGALDEAHFYDRALTASEVVTLAGYSGTVNTTAGLVDYFHLNEASGATVMSDSKNLANGTYVNAPTLGSTPGIITNDSDTAVTFTGTQYATHTRQISANFSMEFWFKSTQNYGASCTQWTNGASLVDSDATGTARDFGVSLCAGKVIAGTGNPDTSVISSGTYNDGAWHQVVMTRTQATGVFTLYVDGASVGTATGNTRTLRSQPNITFGRLASSAVNFYVGSLDEVSIYNVALSGATVLAHYNAR